MRILVLQESDWIERGPHQSHHLLERLNTKGHQVRVVDFEIGWRSGNREGVWSRRKEFSPRGKVVDSNIEVVRPFMVRLPILDYVSLFLTHWMEVRKQLRKFQPDVVLGFGLLNAFVGMHLARTQGIPFVYYLIDRLATLVPERALQGLARVVEQSNLRRASLVLSINEELKDYTMAMGAPEGLTRVLPAGVDLTRFGAGDGSKIRAQYGLDREDLVLFFMGWIYPFSGLREVAASIVAGEGPESPVRLLVVGKGDLWSELAQLVERNRAEDRIKLVGFRPYAEMPAYLAAADICVLPAHDVETMRSIVPIKMYEYLAAGKPVIATRLPGLVKEFGEGHGVVYVDRPEEVIRKAIELAREGSLSELGRSGREFVSGNDWERITQLFESYLTSLVKNRRS